MNYILGPMKCSGKQRPYPSEIEQFYDGINKQKLNNVEDSNYKKDLTALDEKFQFQSRNISVRLKSSIQNVTEVLQRDSEIWKQEINSWNNELNKTQDRVKEQEEKLRLGDSAREI